MMISVEATGCGFGDGQSVSSPSGSDVEFSRGIYRCGNHDWEETLLREVRI
jgi:hypothetical protein